MVIGGAGYVGSELVPKLLMLNYKVSFRFVYVWRNIGSTWKLGNCKGDMRNIEILNKY